MQCCRQYSSARPIPSGGNVRQRERGRPTAARDWRPAAGLFRVRSPLAGCSPPGPRPSSMSVASSVALPSTVACYHWRTNPLDVARQHSPPGGRLVRGECERPHCLPCARRLATPAVPRPQARYRRVQMLARQTSASCGRRPLESRPSWGGIPTGARLRRLAAALAAAQAGSRREQGTLRRQHARACYWAQRARAARTSDARLDGRQAGRARRVLA